MRDNMNGLSKKIYLELTIPTEEDCVSGQVRILKGLEAQGICAAMPLKTIQQLYPLCDDAQWKITASLAWDGDIWQVVKLESGDTTQHHYGLAVDLGSTTVVMRLVQCDTGEVLAQESVYNHQIQYGEDILTRIFYGKDQPEHRQEIQKATIDTFTEVMDRLCAHTNVCSEEIISMVVSGNTTMIHLLLGLDAFCVFQSPYAVRTLAPGFLRSEDLGLSLCGYVYCVPGMANYLGGDIISGMIATGFYKKDGISLFFDVGTNGELVVGGKDFLLCGAGAAGPALEGGVVRTGMRAANGAVEHVQLHQGNFVLDVIGGDQGVSPVGICGSGIVDLIAELFLHGWINLRGDFIEEKSSLIQWRETQEERRELAVEYAPGLYFFESDIKEFIKTKAAAATMIEYMLLETGMGPSDIDAFYMAGAFGAHIDVESAVTIGMYPDVNRSQIVPCGNTSLEGAVKLLLDQALLQDIDRILSLMSYVQFGAVDDFLTMMQAASVIPHTDMQRYPSVSEKLQRTLSKLL